MKRWSLLLCMVFLAEGIVCGQQESGQRPTLGAPSGRSRPTLSGAAPSLRGPMTANIVDARALRSVRKIYIGNFDYALTAKLRADLEKDRMFRVVSERSKADAVLEGSCFSLRRLKDVHTEIYLTGKNGKAIWQDIIHEPYLPPPLPKALDETAQLIVAHLRASIAQAEHGGGGPPPSGMQPGMVPLGMSPAGMPPTQTPPPGTPGP